MNRIVLDIVGLCGRSSVDSFAELSGNCDWLDQDSPVHDNLIFYDLLIMKVPITFPLQICIKILWHKTIP